MREAAHGKTIIRTPHSEINLCLEMAVGPTEAHQHFWEGGFASWDILHETDIIIMLFKNRIAPVHN